MSYFWLNCGYNRFNHFEDLMGQVSVFDSTVHFNPNEGYAAFKRAQPGDRVIFYQVQNKIGILGAGSVLKLEEPRRGQIKIHFKYEEKLAPITKEYLVRDEQLKLEILAMKEQLLNPLTEDSFNKIIRVGRHEEKINRYFLMKEAIDFEAGETYTIYVRNINGVNRNGFVHYGQMQEGDKVIIYKTYPERGIYGIAEVKEGMRQFSPIPGRTDSTAVTIQYIQDITPRTIYELDREPMLRAQYFLEEKWNESVTEITKNQYHACLTPSEEAQPIKPSIHQVIETAQYSARKEAAQKKFESLKQLEDTDSVQSKTWKCLHIFSLPESVNGLDTAMKFMQLTPGDVAIYSADQSWHSANLYGQYVREEDTVLFHQGIITEALSAVVRKDVMVDNFHHITPEQLKPLMHAAQGRTVALPVLHELMRATIGLHEDATYQLDESFRIIGITHLSVDDFKAKYPSYMYPYMKFYVY
ncbi:EVE domain-containing protein [Macrococcoides caseolyticum]|uniref:EVE domain-containing protein n=1 Tax=Macrococcoides caseolyticum TaxID=69966 RepID=UPI001F282733|nr:EVE domain-containing protein [Macrococcus caseolyticus]MCE4957793.1 EVE domain-containing protein [Macrococcus caseolyticus]